MFDPSISLFQLLGILFYVTLFCFTMGVTVGKSIQRKRDTWSFGPSYLRTGKEPRWIVSKPFQYPRR